MPDSAYRKGRILIADDDEAIRDLMKSLLVQRQYDVVDVGDGEAAVKEARHQEFDLILLDMQMPGMNGIEVLRTLRLEGTSSDFLIITGQHDVGLAVESMKLGASEYLVKPFAPNDFLELVATTLTSHFAEERIKKIQEEFSSRLLYEIRSPLTSIDTSLTFVLHRSSDTLSDQQRDILEQASNDIDRIIRLLNDMIDLSKLESGHLTLEKLPTNLDEFVPMVCRHLEPRVRAKRITLTLHISPGIPTISLDTEKIEQVLVNILDNAIEYTNETGKISVSVSMKEQSYEGKPHEFVAIAVSDSGVGISPEDLPLLFDKYKEFTKSRATSKKSTGLGLPISKNIIVAHGGHIEAESKVGIGSTFRIYLPADPF